MCAQCQKDWANGKRWTAGHDSRAWSRHAKAELQANSKDTLQPTTKHGTINKNFIAAHGTKTLEKEWKMSKEQIEKYAE